MSETFLEQQPRLAMNRSQTALKKAESLDIAKLTRPAPILRWYYAVLSLLGGPAFPLVFAPLLIKYATLRYRFDESGISMSWGFVFRREIYLTYRRIQDIHVTRNLLQRWMGLATVGVQTASGSSAPEMNIEGILEIEELRDFLYSRMRGARGEQLAAAESEADSDSSEADSPQTADDAATVLLCEIRDSLKVVAERLQKNT